MKRLPKPVTPFVPREPLRTCTLQLSAVDLHAETPTAPAVANLEASIAQIEQAIAAEEASIESQIEDIEDVGTPWFDNSDHHPIIEKFLALWGDAKALKDQLHAIGRLRWAIREWRLQIPGDDFGFGGGERFDYYMYWNPEFEDVDEIAAKIEKSLQHLKDLQAALDKLKQAVAGLKGSANAPGRSSVIRGVQDGAQIRPRPRMPSGPPNSGRPPGKRY